MLILKHKLKILAESISQIGLYVHKGREIEIHHLNDAEIKRTPSPVIIHPKLGEMHFSLESNFNIDVFSQFNISNSITDEGALSIEHEFYVAFNNTNGQESIKLNDEELSIDGVHVDLSLRALTSNPFSEKLVISDLEWLLDSEPLNIKTETIIISH